MTTERRAEKRRNMMMWAMLTLPVREDWSWRYLLEWAALGGADGMASVLGQIPLQGVQLSPQGDGFLASSQVEDELTNQGPKVRIGKRVVAVADHDIQDGKAEFDIHPPMVLPLGGADVPAPADALRQAAEQFVASCKDGNVADLIGYYEEIFAGALGVRVCDEGECRAAERDSIICVGECDVAAGRRPDGLGVDRRGCECAACKVTPHASDCAVHNEPAMPAGPCDCGAPSGVAPSDGGQR